MADYDTTTEPYPTPGAGTQSASAAGTFVPARRVVAADGSELATETRWLLQQRLKAASLVLVVGFSLVFGRLVILYQFESLAVFFYGVLLALLILCTTALSGRWQPPLRRLRQLEICALCPDRYSVHGRAVCSDAPRLCAKTTPHVWPGPSRSARYGWSPLCSLTRFLSPTPGAEPPG